MAVSMRLVCTCLFSAGFLAPACGGEGDPGGGGGSSGGSSSSTGTPQTSSTGPASTSTGAETASASGVGSSSSGVADSSSTGSLPSEVGFGGTVRDFLGIIGVAGVDVSIEEFEDLATTSDEEGFFSFDDMPPDTPVNLIFDPPPDGDPLYSGSIVPERTGVMDRDDIDAAVVQTSFIESQIAGLEDQMPAAVDLDAAIIVVRVNPAAVTVGTVTLDVRPPPAPGTFYAPNENGAPVLDSTEIAFDNLPAAVFFNVPDSDAGDITITAEHDSGIIPCAVQHPHAITRGGYITQVSVFCEL